MPAPLKTSAIAALLLLHVSVGLAAGQDAAPPDRARLLFTEKDLVHVEPISGAAVTGTFVRFDGDTISLLVAGQRTDIRLNSVSRVEVEHRDSLKNGTAIGALALGAWCAFICAQGLSSTSEIPLAILGGAVWGALIGAGIDAGHHQRVTLHRRTTASLPVPTGPHLAVAYRLTF